MDVSMPNYLSNVDLFINTLRYNGTIDIDDPKKVLEGFEAAFDALGGLSQYDQDAEKLAEVVKQLTITVTN